MKALMVRPPARVLKAFEDPVLTEFVDGFHAVCEMGGAPAAVSRHRDGGGLVAKVHLPLA